MGPLDFLKKVFKPVRAAAELIVGNKDFVAQLDQLEAEVALEVLTLRKTIVEGQTAVLIAEAQSDSTLTRIWRPIIMLSFAACVVGSFIFNKPIAVELMWTINLGIGGYIGSRGFEKAAPAVARIFKALS